MGLRFSVYDGGLRADQAKKANFPFPVREELATVAYASNLLKSRPHEISMTVRDTAALEGDAPNGSAVSGTDGAGTDGAGTDGASAARKRMPQPLADLQSENAPGVHTCHNVMPEWDDALQAFTLPFYQRVVLPSKKNVHVVEPHAPNDIVLLFGKRAKSADGRITTFSLDFCRPISCLVAFGLALTSFFGST